MSPINFKEIIKNKYFIPVLIGIIVAVGGILIGTSRDKGGMTNVTDTGKEPSVVEIKGKSDLKSLIFGQKEFNLTYADTDSSLVENISFFESNENWQGNGFLDWRNFYEGKSSLGISSNNNQPGTIFLEKNLDLSNFETIEFLVSLNDIQSLESATIKFGDSSLTNYYSYSLSNLLQGWKFIRIPKNQFVAHKVSSEFSWKDIKKIQFEIVSRPNSTAIANFDYLTAQKSTDYLGKWKTVDENFLSLGKSDDKVVLMARNEGALQAILNGVSGDNFTFQASFVPKTIGAVGLFFRGNYGNNRGYYLLANGLNTSSCTLKKLGVKGWEELSKTEIANFVFEKDQKYWLRAETSGKKITGFISVDGENFTELFSANDDEFASGGVGIAIFSRGYSFFDDFKFKQ
ncbi:MAG: hypothetical protein Q8N88_02485 [Nanoarchaeota archaeon]|nr:hypothetical protein [Nanoarchaeota archaeon]